MNWSEPPDTVRTWIARTFTMVEDVVYVGLALLLACSALVLLGSSAIQLGQIILARSLPSHIVTLLDQILLVLIIVELLYTVQVSFREHTIVPGPFLLVGLIAAVRRVLIVTAQFGEAGHKSDSELTWFVIELGVLTILILALVVSTRLLSKAGPHARAERA